MTDNTERYMIDDAGTLIDKKTCTCYDYLEEILPTLNQQENRIKELEQEKESWKNSTCHDMNLKSMLSFEISKLTETKDIEKFLDFYYKYFCKINGDDNDGKS